MFNRQKEESLVPFVCSASPRSPQTGSGGVIYQNCDDFDKYLQNRHTCGMNFNIRIVKLFACHSSSRACETTA